MTDLEVRRATPDDRGAVLGLMARALGWRQGDPNAELFAWKHEQSPFGSSPAWVALDGLQLVGFRTFMRWEFERDGELVGIAMSGPPLDADAAWTRQLYVLYVSATDHGTGAGLALLESVVDPAESTALWVADPNPRAQAFYRKHGFVADGMTQVDGGVQEIRMVRSAVLA